VEFYLDYFDFVNDTAEIVSPASLISLKFFLLYMFIHQKTFFTLFTESALWSHNPGVPALLFIPTPIYKLARE
jgi:hypothetical protein